MKKHVQEEFKKIPKNIDKLIENEELNIINDDYDEDNEIMPEDLISLTQRANKAFYSGRGNISEDYPSPEDILKEYQEFN